MFKRLKRALTESYIGAVALGWLLAQDVVQFVGVFATPVAEWVSQKEYPQLRGQTGAPRLSFEFAMPELIRFLLILAIWYGLVRWLYFDSSNKQASQPPKQEQAA
jgi:predicted Kef-type K+ transport protein